MNTTLVLNKQDIIYCDSFFKRLKGMLLSKYNSNKVYCFPKCNSIHTFFMKENIDVIMCDKDNNILYYYKDLGKNKVILPKKNVRKVFETPSNYFDIKIGKKMIISEN